MGFEDRKKALVFVPHQDDEINLIGNCVGKLTDSYDVTVVYSSIDSDTKRAAIRKTEALNACAELGLNTNSIFFLDFPDSPNRNGYHFFNQERTGVINTLITLIETSLPDLIIGTDFDYHADHRMLSIALDCSVGKVVKKYNQKYRPLYLKGFCYETAFCGVKDLFSSYYGPTVCIDEILSNPSFEWEKRVTISENDYERYLFRNKAFRALRRYKSQYATLRADSVINSDNVFWRKRTDNLLLDENVKIEASSGDIDRINDFLIIDTNDIVPLDPRKLDYSKALWVPCPEDIDPTITLTLAEAHSIDRIVIHGSVQDINCVNVSGMVSINGKSFAIKELNPYGRDTVVPIGGMRTNRIEIKFSGHIEISEIEMFECAKIDNGESLFAKNKQHVNSKLFFMCEKLLFCCMCILLKAHRKIGGRILHH